MWNIVRRRSRWCRMSAAGGGGGGGGVSAEAPLGVQLLQRMAGRCCPRLRINRLRWYQASVLLLTYVAYLTYHLTRKPISVVKSVLHRNCSALAPPPGPPPDNDTWCDWPPFDRADANTLLGALDSAFLFSYAAAMFVSGMVAERVDLRYFLSLGMLASAAACWLFGLARVYDIHHIAFYILVQAGAGVAQTSGWPGTVATVGKWFGGAKRGLIFGIWNSHTSLGNILGTLIAAEYVDSDWALSFVLPALVMGVAAGVVWLFLVADPAHVGLAPPDHTSGRQSRCSDGEETESEPETAQVVGGGDQAASWRPAGRHSANATQREVEATEQTSLLPRRGSHAVPLARAPPPHAISLARALRIPGVVSFSLSLFFAKLVSYTFLYWLPLYINTSTNLSARASGELSTVFDVGGAAGAVLAGLLADTSRAPAAVCVGFFALAGPALVSYSVWGADSYLVSCLLLAGTGLLVNGPYALITTAVSADLGTHSSLAGNSAALATVTAIIDGTGSLGAALGPLLAGLVSSAGSWAHVFYMLIACNYCALFLLVRIAWTEVVQLRQRRRLQLRPAAAPRVRIE